MYAKYVSAASAQATGKFVGSNRPTNGMPGPENSRPTAPDRIF